ncbi:hypothetical protein [Reyranella soli]|jgi:hypothetical protein|uniref:Thioredoxin-like fold domain-containing protein n=1 Tax=Reyranella soli TaxID=1230389 RepID=A0A512NFM4_9HYPH|nr:hypothetical protein [Reyranella soli]GEP57722.1 hypothetical protein RSO01_48880 [Reyranella soli]
MNRRTFVVAGLLVGSMRLPAQAASALEVIYIGGSDCQPCKAWKNKYKAQWLASAEYRQVTWIEVEPPKLKEAYQERFWPGDLKPILDQLPRKSGTPRFLVVLDGKVVANELGVSHWTRIVEVLRKQLA